MDDKVSIVIPNYNRWDLTHILLFGLYQRCASIDEIIVVNDGCTQEESFSGLDWWKSTELLPVRELRLKKNVGFLKASNAGMKQATGDITILISNDVIVRGDIVLRIRHNIDMIPNVLVGGRLLDWNTGWNEFDGKIFPYLEGWLLAARSDLLEHIDYFDEQYAPHDFEDVDISTKVIEQVAGSLVALPEDITFHQSAQTIGYNPEREELTKQNREKFREKWLK